MPDLPKKLKSLIRELEGASQNIQLAVRNQKQIERIANDLEGYSTNMDVPEEARAEAQKRHQEALSRLEEIKKQEAKNLEETKKAEANKPTVMRAQVTKKSHGGNHHGGKKGPQDTNLMRKGKPELLGEAFHNPYTFVPFHYENVFKNKNEPTLLTADEKLEEERHTGVLRLTLKTATPMLIKSGETLKEREARKANRKHKKEDEAHKEYEALTIGDDVIMPSTSIRGFLRYLMTLVTSSPLSYLDKELYLCQGRDLNLGPDEIQEVYMARVVKPGHYERSGVIRMGRVKLVPLHIIHAAVARFQNSKIHSEGAARAYDDWKKSTKEFKAAKKAKSPSLNEIRKENFDHERKLNDITKKHEKDLRMDSYRGPKGEKLYGWYEGTELLLTENANDKKIEFELRLSGRPIKLAGKKEAIFWDNHGHDMDIPPHIWAAYMNRYKFGDRSELKKGDLVWVEKYPNSPEIESHQDIVSLQWARWGRQGTGITDVIPRDMFPDWMSEEQVFSFISDLFGIVSPDKDATCLALASRIRPENCVFKNAKSKLNKPMPLAVMGVPHPGCRPFYRQTSSPDTVSSQDKFRGVKIYRTTKEEGDKAPWNFKEQGTYDNGTVAKGEESKVTFSAPLLQAGAEGELTIAFRSLSKEEIALLLAVCQVPWRLGGGKPLGLGLCHIESMELLDEDGEMMFVDRSGWKKPEDGADIELPEDLLPSLKDACKERLDYWKMTQEPVAKLRYPRCCSKNNNNLQRGGHQWFSKCASPKKAGDGEALGLEPIYVCGELKDNVRNSGVNNSNSGQEIDLISGQILPQFDPEHPLDDVLYGYDIVFDENQREKHPFNTKKNVDSFPSLEPFSEAKHSPKDKRHHDNYSQNAKSRHENKRSR